MQKQKRGGNLNQCNKEGTKTFTSTEKFNTTKQSYNWEKLCASFCASFRQTQLIQSVKKMSQSWRCNDMAYLIALQ